MTRALPASEHRAAIICLGIGLAVGLAMCIVFGILGVGK